MKESKIIIHIPHSSLKMPRFFKKRFLLKYDVIKSENIDMADLYVNKLIEVKNWNTVIFRYSRLFCDVEKFKDDSMEVMSKKGMGCIYTNTYNYDNFISYDKKYREYVINKYYDKHHNKLSNKTTKVLNKYNNCIIIDLHSFSDKMVKKLLNLEDNPDICIGIDDEFNYIELSKYTIDFFKSRGYSVKINYPYSGTMVPTEYYLSKDKRVKSIMIEINKRIYLDDNNINDNKFIQLKAALKEYLNVVNSKF